MYLEKVTQFKCKLFDYERYHVKLTVHLSNKPKISLRIKKWTSKKTIILVSNNKNPSGIRYRDVCITSPTRYPLGYGISYILFLIKSLLIKQYEVLIRGQQFCDGVLFHLFGGRNNATSALTFIRYSVYHEFLFSRHSDCCLWFMEWRCQGCL